MCEVKCLDRFDEQELPLLARRLLKEASWKECGQGEQEQGRCRGGRILPCPKVGQCFCPSKKAHFLQLQGKERKKKGGRILPCCPEVGQCHHFPPTGHIVVDQLMP